ACRVEVVRKDWFNFVSVGFDVVPLGNSDTHTVVKDPMGMPRTMVRVGDDSADAIASGSVEQPLLDPLLGQGPSPRDVVVTTGPMIRVSEQGETGSAIGQVIAGSGGEVTLDIGVQSPRWAAFDTIEVFANSVPDIKSNETVL